MDLARLVTVEVYETAATARLAQGRLEAAGIDAVLIDEHSATMIPIYSAALGGIKLQVREEDEQEALEVLADPGVSPPAGHDLCPRCGSDLSAVRPRFADPHRLLRLVTGAPGVSFSRPRSCSRCGAEWS